MDPQEHVDHIRTEGGRSYGTPGGVRNGAFWTNEVLSLGIPKNKTRGGMPNGAAGGSAVKPKAVSMLGVSVSTSGEHGLNMLT